MEPNEPRRLDDIQVQITWPAGRIYYYCDESELVLTPHLRDIFPDTRVSVIGMAVLPGADAETATEDGNRIEISKNVPMEDVVAEVQAMLKALHQLRFVGEIP